MPWFAFVQLAGLSGLAVVVATAVREVRRRAEAPGGARRLAVTVATSGAVLVVVAVVAAWRAGEDALARSPSPPSLADRARVEARMTASATWDAALFGSLHVPALFVSLWLRRNATAPASPARGDD